MINIDTAMQQPSTTSPIKDCLARFQFHPVLISEVSALDRPAVIVAVSKGLLRAWRDSHENFGYEITDRGMQELER